MTRPFATCVVAAVLGFTGCASPNAGLTVADSASQDSAAVIIKDVQAEPAVIHTESADQHTTSYEGGDVWRGRVESAVNAVGTWGLGAVAVLGSFWVVVEVLKLRWRKKNGSC